MADLCAPVASTEQESAPRQPPARSTGAPRERLFFALWPPDGVRDGLAGLQRALPAGGRHSHPLDLHLTLVFVGAVNPRARPCVMAAGDGLRAAPFDLLLDEAGGWAEPHIRWCRPSGPPEALTTLVRALQGRLRTCGIEPERRRFKPHVTLARKAPPLDAMALPAPLRWPVADFVLAASLPGRTPHYEVLRRWPLG